MVRIRLARFGGKKTPFYRIVVIDSRKQRDGQPIAYAGHFNPFTEDLKMNPRTMYIWLNRGAQMSNTCKALWKRYLKQLKFVLDPSSIASLDHSSIAFINTSSDT